MHPLQNLRWLSMQGAREDRRRGCRGQARPGNRKAHSENKFQGNASSPHQRRPPRERGGVREQRLHRTNHRARDRAVSERS